MCEFYAEEFIDMALDILWGKFLGWTGFEHWANNTQLISNHDYQGFNISSIIIIRPSKSLQKFDWVQLD